MVNRNRTSRIDCGPPTRRSARPTLARLPSIETKHLARYRLSGTCPHSFQARLHGLRRTDRAFRLFKLGDLRRCKRRVPRPTSKRLALASSYSPPTQIEKSKSPGRSDDLQDAGRARCYNPGYGKPGWAEPKSPSASTCFCLGRLGRISRAVLSPTLGPDGMPGFL